MGDYYNILGISKEASDDDIKRAYRKLAREHHPDKGGDKERFQQIQMAYETLSDPQKRGAYDNPAPQFNMGDMGFNFNMGGFFNEGNNANNIIKKAEHFYACKLTLKDVFFGIKKRFKVKREKICKQCYKNCENCNGTGNIKQRIQLGPFTQIVQHLCNACGGKGIYVEKDNCNNCSGNRVIKEEKIIEIDIPRGVENGKQYIFEEWGEQATKSNEISGPLIVTVQIEEHPEFKRADLDLVYTINLTLSESIIGKHVVIKHFDGDLQLDTRGFGIINPNKQYTIFSRGIINENGKVGNMHIRFNINYPSKSLQDSEIIVLRRAFESVNL